jgi:hypothetical protein
MRHFVSDFMLPLVRGGAVHVGRPLGMEAVARLAQDLPAIDGPAVDALAACRRVVVTRVVPGAAPPPLDDASLRLAAALHDLLALSHPDIWHSSRRQERISAAALELAALGPPPAALAALERHSLLSRLPEIVRIDRTVRFWLGQRSYVGQTPPKRVTALPALRRVRVERTGRSWLREIGIPAVARRAFLTLNVASPLGEALDPLRLEPPISWGRILPVLRFPSLARAVASRAVESGVERVGDALADALYRFASFHDPPVGVYASAEALAFAVRFLAHLVWLDVLFGTPAKEPGAARPRAVEPGVDLAVMLTAASQVWQGLVWPADVSRTGDLADAFRARLTLLASRAEARGMPRFAAAHEIATLAAQPARSEPLSTAGH